VAVSLSCLLFYWKISCLPAEGKIPSQTICTPSEKAKKKEGFLIVFVVVACGYSPIALTYL
jgi:hypothetical protein